MAESQKQYLHVFYQATELLGQRDYHSLANLVKGNPAFALEKGKAVVGLMYDHFFRDEKPFDYGYQLTGDQLQVLAYARKAGARVGEGDITVYFDYVARIEKTGREYWAEFPDFLGCISEGDNLSVIHQGVREALIGYVSSKMLHGETLPKPKYQGRKTARVRPFKVELTLKDLDFRDTRK